MKNDLGYLETHLFTTLDGRVKHGITISIEITKNQIPIVCLDFVDLRHYTTFEKRVNVEAQRFQKNNKLKHRKSDSPSKFT